MQAKLSALRKIQQIPSNQAFSSSTMNPVISPASSYCPSSSTLFDPQTQIMMMLTVSFSKLTIDLGDKTVDLKSEWPCFLGNPKKIIPDIYQLLHRFLFLHGKHEKKVKVSIKTEK
jgi:hypothetical protein